MGLFNKVKAEMSAWVHLLVGIAIGGLGMVMVARSPVTGTTLLVILESLVIWSFFKTKKRIMANENPSVAKKK